MTPARRSIPLRRRNDRGQALVEFALITPIFLALVLLVVDFGFAMDRRLTLQHAVREGARYAALSIDNDFVCDRTVAQSFGGLDPEDVVITYDDINGNGDVTDAGDAINVKADYTWTFPFAQDVFTMLGLSSPSIDIGPTGSARLERSHPNEFQCPAP
jgi:Flp pilus assembly protein TadG